MFTPLLANFAHDMTHTLDEPAQWLALGSVAVAAVLVVVSSFVKTMIPLRWLAVGSNVGFLGYGVLHPSLPMVLLHSLLLPINVYRAIEMVQLTRRVAAVAGGTRAGPGAGPPTGPSGASPTPQGDLLKIWLRPYMRSKKVKAGTVLFRQGDFAERLYLLAAGRIELVEIGHTLAPGTIFGEIAFFSPDRRRRLTACCTEDSTVLSIDEDTVRQLYFQNPAFGFELIGLVAGRLSADIDRLQQRLSADTTARPATQD